MPKVLVTGVAGFVGSHVAEYYINKGWEVIGIDNLTDFELKRAKYDVEKARKHTLDFLNKIGVDFRQEDCRFTPYSIYKGIDLIIHCAAQPAMTIAIEHPVYDFDNNVKSVVNMLEIAKELKVPFINCSSIHIYGNDLNKECYEDADGTRFECEPPEISEIHPILKGDLTPLHVSKRATELYTQTYAETYGMRTASFRLTGMYGPRQFGGMDHGWVANFAIRAILNRPITIFGTDKQVRDILYASDVCRAFDMWFEKGSSGIFNIGGGMECSISLGECLTKLGHLLSDGEGKILDITTEPARFGDLHYFVCDYKKAYEDFGWKPKILPDLGLVKIIEWIKDNEELFR